MMLTELIRSFSDKEKIASYYIGRKYQRKFELPDNILVFMHDFFFDDLLIHGRHVLLFPAVPLIFKREKGSENMKVDPGQVAYFLPFQCHLLVKNYRDTVHGYPRLLITFEGSQKQDYLPKSILTRVTPRAEKFLVELLHSYHNKNNTEVATLLYLLLNELSRNRENQLIEHHSEKVQKTLSYIHRNLDKQFGITELCEYTQTSMTNLQLHFGREMGCTIGAYITNQRIAIAKNYLQKNELHVEEIARLCGFQSIYAFSHFFKKHEKVSPLNWKKKK